MKPSGTKNATFATMSGKARTPSFARSSKKPSGLNRGSMP